MAVRDARETGGAWATFQFLLRQRLVEEGATVAADGKLG